jgi:hypothetical protein
MASNIFGDVFRGTSSDVDTKIETATADFGFHIIDRVEIPAEGLSSIIFDDLSEYDHFRLVFAGVETSTADTTIYMNLRSSEVNDLTESGYKTTILYYSMDGAESAGYLRETTTQIKVAPAIGTQDSNVCCNYLFSGMKSATTKTSISGACQWIASVSSQRFGANVESCRDTLASFDGIRIFSTNPMTGGVVTIYGINGNEAVL